MVVTRDQGGRKVHRRPGASVLRREVAKADAAVACAGEDSARVEIVEPADGAIVNSRDVWVKLAAAGFEIVPASEERSGTAHHHLFVDTALTLPSDTIPAGITGIVHLGRGQTEFVVQGLAPGAHRVIAILADWAHLPLDPLADTVRFTVRS